MGPLYRPTEDRAEGGGGLVAGESIGSEGGVVETAQKTCPFLLANRGWICELGATKGLSLHRTREFQQDRASEKTGLLRTNTTSAYSTTVLFEWYSQSGCLFL